MTTSIPPDADAVPLPGPHAEFTKRLGHPVLSIPQALVYGERCREDERARLDRPDDAQLELWRRLGDKLLTMQPDAALLRQAAMQLQNAYLSWRGARLAAQAPAAPSDPEIDELWTDVTGLRPQNCAITFCKEILARWGAAAPVLTASTEPQHLLAVETFHNLDRLLKPLGWPAQKLLRDYVEILKGVFFGASANRDDAAASTEPESASKGQYGKFWTWLRRAYREPHGLFTVFNMEVAWTAGREFGRGDTRMDLGEDAAASTEPAPDARDEREPVAWFAFGESNGPVPLELYGWDRKACLHAVLTNARATGWKGTVNGYLFKMGWRVMPVYLADAALSASTAPPAAQAVEVTAGREPATDVKALRLHADIVERAGNPVAPCNMRAAANTIELLRAIVASQADALAAHSAQSGSDAKGERS